MTLPRWIRRLGRTLLTEQARTNAIYEFRRRGRVPPALPDGKLQHVLVICHGNICRSPFAGVLLAQRVPDLVVRSAGLSAQNGNPAEPAARRVATRFGVDLGAHRSQPMRDEDVAWADLILTMEAHHSVRLARRWPQGMDKTRLLGDYLPDPPYSIRDPWGQDDALFEQVFARIVDAIARLADARSP